MPAGDCLKGANALGRLLTTLRDLYSQESNNPARAAGKLLAMADTSGLVINNQPVIPKNAGKEKQP